MAELSILYDQDIATWSLHQAELLKAGRFLELDLEHLLEELSGMSRSERDELENRLTILLAHLLKWQFQYQTLAAQWRGFAGQSWQYTIIEQRNRIHKRLLRSPALKSKLTGILQEAYQDAVDLAAEETRLPNATFPPVCPYAWEQIIDKDFYPQPD